MQTWLAATAGGGAAAVGHTVRVVSYNILAPRVAHNHSYCRRELLSWNHRGQVLLEQFEALRPDLLCLQEVQADAYVSTLEPWLRAAGYGSIVCWCGGGASASCCGGSSRSRHHHQQDRSHQHDAPADSADCAGANAPEAEGPSLHYSKSLFSLIAWECAELGGAAAAVDARLPAACCARHAPTASTSARFSRVLDARDERAVLALLRHEPSGRPLLVASAHLHWNPALPDVKVAQAAALCGAAASFAERHGHAGGAEELLPLVVAGDFNSLPVKWASDRWDEVPAGGHLVSGVYDLLTHGAIGPDHHDHPAHRTCMQCGGARKTNRRRDAARRVAATMPSAAAAAQQQQQQQHQQQNQDDPAAPAVGTAAADGHGPASSSSSSSSGSGSDGAGNDSDAQYVVDHTFTTSGLKFVTAHMLAHGREPPLTTRTASFSGTLDYVWVSPSHWDVSHTLALPYPLPPTAVPPSAVPATYGPWPDEKQPSDHLPVGATLVLLPP